MKAKFLKFLHVLNVPKKIVRFLIGDDHSVAHRMTAGIAVMGVGVFVAKAGGDIHFYGIHYLADGLGYGIHGLGLTPFIDWFMADGAAKEAVRQTVSAIEHGFADTEPMHVE